MKIAFTCNNLNNGGAERVISNIANEMARDGVFVKIICYKKMDSFYYSLNKSVEIDELDPNINNRKSFFARKLSGVVNLFKLFKALKGNDRVVSFYTRQNCYTILACKLLGIPVICSERDHFFTQDGKINHILRKLFYPMADGFIHQTKMAQELLRDNEGVCCKDTVIPNPLWIREFPARKSCRGRIVSVGRLADQKNYFQLIEGVEKAYKKCSYITLHIYGDGPLKKEIQEFINKKKLHDVVFLEDITHDVLNVLAEAEMFVMFSNGEGYPNALLEALAMGVPSISSDCLVGGPRDMILSGVNGFLVQCSDVEDLSEKIVLLSENEKLRDQFNKEAIKIRETNEFSKIYKSYFEFITSIS